MSELARIRLPTIGRALMILAAAVMLLASLLAGGASAHGAPIDPASRAYSCWARWGDDFQNPDMETEDPMCWQAWQADPDAMWNWNGLLRDGVGGDHQAAVPDGELCSGGLTSDGRYAALDTPGPWQATPVDNDFTVTVHDQAQHGADYYRVYVTEQGFDPTTDELGWDDLELVTETDSFAPGEGTANETGGVNVSFDASAPGRTGQHIVFTIWQASHSDQSYYWCSDVVFPGGDGDTPVAEEPDVPVEDLSEPEVPDAGDSGSEEQPAEDAGGEEPAAEEPETDTPDAETPTANGDEQQSGGFNFDALLDQLLGIFTLIRDFVGL